MCRVPPSSRSSARCVATLVILVGLAVASAPVRAQDALITAAERARLEAEMTRLENRMEAIRGLEASAEEGRERQAERALRRIQEGGLTETIGPLVIRRPSGTPPVAAQVLPVLAAFEATLGDLDDLEISPIHLYLPAELGPLRPPPRARSESGAPVWYRYSDAGLRRIGERVTAHIIASVPTPIGTWSAGAGWGDDYRPLAALRSMAMVADPTGLRCLQFGDIDACARFLLVEDDGSDETRLRAWRGYYSLSRARMLEEHGATIPLLQCIGRSRRTGLPVPRTGCLRQLSRRSISADFQADRYVRGSVVAYALERGGPGALDRIERLPAGVDVGEQLEAISGMPTRDLITAWRADAMNGEGMFEKVGGDPPGPVSLLWAGGFALLALRSTRWRLG